MPEPLPFQDSSGKEPYADAPVDARSGRKWIDPDSGFPYPIGTPIDPNSDPANPTVLDE